MDESEWLAERFEEHRTHLRAVAYRMLGSLSEADDAVQDAWLRVEPGGADEVENLGGWLTTVVARVCLNMLRSRNAGARSHSRYTCPTRSSVRSGDRNRSRSAAGRLRRPRAPRRARHPGAGGAAGVRAARHVRPAVRGDRPDGRADPGGGAATRQPGPAPGEGRRGAGVRTPTSRVNERWSTPSSRQRAGETSTRSSPCSTPTSCCGIDAGAELPAGSMVVDGAEAVARQTLTGLASTLARPAIELRPALVNGVPGVVVTLRGRPMTVIGFTIAAGRIAEIDAIADPERVRRIAAAVLEEN